MQALGIDIGGSGIKGALVDTLKGRFIGDRIRIPTPSSFERGAVSEAIASLVREFDFRGPVGAGFPAAVANGIVLTPPTAHHVPGWQDRDVNALFAEAAGVPVAVLNDADAAGLAEAGTESHSTVTSAGTLMLGAVVSSTVMVWTHWLTLPQASVTYDIIAMDSGPNGDFLEIDVNYTAGIWRFQLISE